LGDIGVDGRIILELSSRDRLWGSGLNSAGSEEVPMIGFCERGNEPS
jgi:hypothetical protein